MMDKLAGGRTYQELHLYIRPDARANDFGGHPGRIASFKIRAAERVKLAETPGALQALLLRGAGPEFFKI